MATTTTKRIQLKSFDRVEITGQVCIDDTGKIGDDTQFDIEQKGTLLKITSKGAQGNSIFMSGNSICMNGGSFSGVSIINGKMMVGPSSSGTITVGNNTISFLGNDITVNGKKCTEDKESNAEKKCPAEEYWIDNSVTIKEIKLSGAGESSIAPKFFGKTLKMEIVGSHSFRKIKNHSFDVFVASVSGSGDIKLENCEIASSVAVIAGSGEIDYGNSKIGSMTGSVTGSGDLFGFYVQKSGIFTVTGSGDIKGCATSDAIVTKSKTGSGDIKIRKY